jgi:hypothetical protein
LIVAKISSDKSKLKAFDLPFAIEENNIHLILKLLSPETVIVLLKQLIFFLIFMEAGMLYLNWKLFPK